MSKQETVMMIGGGIQEVKAVKIAQSAGYKVIVTDRNIDAPCFHIADYTAKIDGRDIEGLIAYTLQNKEELNITGVFTLTELVTSVAAVANACDLPGVSLKSAVACQNKQLCKETWLKDKIPAPSGMVVKSISEAKSLYNKLNKKVFSKPIVGFGGKGAQKILTQKELESYFSSNDGNEILMEEFLVGSMHDVNAVFDFNGKFIPLGCFDRYFKDDILIETGAVYPSQLKKNQLKEAYTLTKNAALSLGINWGPVKSDLILTENGFQILEMAPRLHGPKGSLYLTSMTDNKNHLERILEILTRNCETINLDVDHRGIAAFDIIDHPGESFSDINGIESIQNQGYEILLLKAKSSRNRYRDSSDVIGYIFSKGNRLDQIWEDLGTVKKALCYN